MIRRIQQLLKPKRRMFVRPLSIPISAISWGSWATPALRRTTVAILATPIWVCHAPWSVAGKARNGLAL
jgi:hypothetical protein